MKSRCTSDSIHSTILMGQGGGNRRSLTHSVLVARLSVSCPLRHAGYNGAAAARPSLGLPIMHQVTVRVPASTSNLGPGFDCLGVALRIYNEVTLSRGRGERLPPMVRSAADTFFRRASAKRFPFACAITGEIPPSRGLGSSAAIRLGVLYGLNELADRPLERR